MYITYCKELYGRDRLESIALGPPCALPECRVRFSLAHNRCAKDFILHLQQKTMLHLPHLAPPVIKLSLQQDCSIEVLLKIVSGTYTMETRQERATPEWELEPDMFEVDSDS